MIGGRLADAVHACDIPVVPKGHGLRHRAVYHARVAAERLHYQQVVELVISLSEYACLCEHQDKSGEHARVCVRARARVREC